MQKILIPTDFSSTAEAALEYAIEIAAKFESEMLLYHAYTFHRNVDYNWDYPKDEQPFEQAIKRQMASTKYKFADKLKQKGLSVQTIIKEENVSALFERKVKEHNISWVIMGSKGASSTLEKVILGSVASTAIEMASVPVLVIPPNHVYKPIQKIILTTDLNEIAPDVLLPLQELALKFDAEVTILYVNKNIDKHKENNIQLDGVKTTFAEVQLSESINQTINAFVEKNEFDMMCMLKREKGFLEKFYKKSVTKSQVFDVKIPLLVLHEK